MQRSPHRVKQDHKRHAQHHSKILKADLTRKQNSQSVAQFLAQRRIKLATLKAGV